MTRTAIIAGAGALPQLLFDRLTAQEAHVVVAALDGVRVSVTGAEPLRFRLERLVPFLDHLTGAGVTRIVMAGAVRRPALEPELFDARTAQIFPQVLALLQPGDDGALRAVIALFEEWDFQVVGADAILPELLPPAGVPTGLNPSAAAAAEAKIGIATVAAMGRDDSGQACVIRGGAVIAREGPEGTDAMLAALAPVAPRSGILVKAPKPGQDRRADLPVIGPETAGAAARAGLSGIVIEAGGVIAVDQPGVIAALDAAGMFLWVRPAGGPPDAAARAGPASPGGAA